MRKYDCGEPITCIEELMCRDFVIFNDKVYSKGWFRGWMLGWVFEKIKTKQLYNVILKKN